MTWMFRNWLHNLIYLIFMEFVISIEMARTRNDFRLGSNMKQHVCYIPYFDDSGLLCNLHVYFNVKVTIIMGWQEAPILQFFSDWISSNLCFNHWMFWEFFLLYFWFVLLIHQYELNFWISFLGSLYCALVYWSAVKADWALKRQLFWNLPCNCLMR